MNDSYLGIERSFAAARPLAHFSIDPFTSSGHRAVQPLPRAFRQGKTCRKPFARSTDCLFRCRSRAVYVIRRGDPGNSRRRLLAAYPLHALADEYPRSPLRSALPRLGGRTIGSPDATRPRLRLRNIAVRRGTHCPFLCMLRVIPTYTTIFIYLGIGIGDRRSDSARAEANISTTSVLIYRPRTDHARAAGRASRSSSP